jgi:hypothetical protein
MKPKNLFMLAGFLALCSCKQGPAGESSQNIPGASSFKENVAIFYAGIRSVDTRSYVKELAFRDFSASPQMPSTIRIDDVAYTDDGKESDLKANDGIYTSHAMYFHNDEVPYNAAELTRATLGAPIASATFKHVNALLSEEVMYAFTGNNKKISDIIPCELEVGEGDCNGEIGWCNNCCVTIHTDKCALTIGS